MKVAVVGCGVAGLCSIHHISDALPDAIIDGFEATGSIGGTWAYSEITGKDEYNVPAMSSMYKNLRTNLPKQIMQFADYPIPEEYKEFMESGEFLTYLKNYAQHFDLEKYIKFRHYVTNVKKLSEGWEVQYKDVKTDEDKCGTYDYVVVCNGHYTQMFTPQYKGLERFEGGQKHSHSYRKPNYYKDKIVLVVGAGPSAQDISIDISKCCKKIILSHHSPRLLSPYPSHYIQKPDVQEFTENSVIFADGSSEEIDEIMFCTGYAYHCPFLDPNAGVTIQRTHMSFLYKHIVNVAHPTMLFIGVPQLCCAVPLMDMQAMYIAALMRGDFQLPSKQEMLGYLTEEYLKRKKLGIKKQDTHNLGEFEDEYYESLSFESGVKKVPKVYCDIRRSTMHTKKNLYTYRNYKYKLLDDYTFIMKYAGDANGIHNGDARKCS